MNKRPDVWPETPTVPIRISTELLRQLADPPEPNPYRSIRLLSLGEPDADGFYNPTLGIVTSPPDDPWWVRAYMAVMRRLFGST